MRIRLKTRRTDLSTLYGYLSRPLHFPPAPPKMARPVTRLDVDLAHARYGADWMKTI